MLLGSMFSDALIGTIQSDSIQVRPSVGHLLQGRSSLSVQRFAVCSLTSSSPSSTYNKTGMASCTGWDIGNFSSNVSCRDRFTEVSYLCHWRAWQFPVAPAAYLKAPELCRKRVQYRCVAEGAVTTSRLRGPKASSRMFLAHPAVQGRPDVDGGLCLTR